MTLNEYSEWRANPQTKEIFKVIDQYIKNLQEDLGNTAGWDSKTDARHAGSIYALKWVLAMEYEETKE